MESCGSSGLEFFPFENVGQVGELYIETLSLEVLGEKDRETAEIQNYSEQECCPT